jgi:hypothetical protein
MTEFKFASSTVITFKVKVLINILEKINNIKEIFL